MSSVAMPIELGAVFWLVQSGMILGYEAKTIQNHNFVQVTNYPIDSSASKWHFISRFLFNFPQKRHHKKCAI